MEKIFESWRKYLTESISLEKEKEVNDAFDYLDRKDAWPTDGRWDNMSWPPSEKEAEEVINYVQKIKDVMPLTDRENKMIGKINIFIMDRISDGLPVPSFLRSGVEKNWSIIEKRKAIEWFESTAPGNF